jgi:hypothetical protein
VRERCDVISRRADISFKAADLIVGKGAPENLRAEAINTVRMTLFITEGSEKDLWLHWQRSGKRGQKNTDKVRKLLVKLSETYPKLPNEVRAALPANIDHDPMYWDDWIRRLDRARKKLVSRRFHYKAQKKLVAAQEAYHLLNHFHREITAEKGSTFCKLAALLCDLSAAKMQWTCRGVLERERLRS